MWVKFYKLYFLIFFIFLFFKQSLKFFFFLITENIFLHIRRWKYGNFMSILFEKNL